MLPALLVLLVLALAPAASAAAPDIHAHRGGTVENGKPASGCARAAGER